jgi:DNA-binding NarL/FixJ family response regulator
MSKIKILLADDHQIVLDGLKSLLSDINDFEVIGAVSNGKDAVDFIATKEKPDIAVLDIDMPVMNGINATREIKKNFNGVRVLTLSMHNEKGVIQTLMDAGADGYILKNSSREELEKGIRAICRGETFFSTDVTMSLLNQSTEITANNELPEEVKDLTEREVEILKLVAEGYSNKEIGERLFISHRTVDTHRTNLMKKMDVHNVAGLIRIALKSGLVDWGWLARINHIQLYYLPFVNTFN